MQKQIEPVVFVAQLHQHRAQQRSAFHVKRQSRALAPQAQRFRLPFVPPADSAGRRPRVAAHTAAFTICTGCPSTTLNVVRQASCRRMISARLRRNVGHVERTPAVDRDRLVVKILGELAVQPDLFLCKRQRRRTGFAAPRNHWHACRRLRHPRLQVFPDQRLLVVIALIHRDSDRTDFCASYGQPDALSAAFTSGLAFCIATRTAFPLRRFAHFDLATPSARAGPDSSATPAVPAPA